MASPNGIATLPRMKPGRRGTLIQLLDIQRMLHKDAMGDKTTPAARSQVARAYSDLEYLKRVIRGKPNPKPVDVSIKLKPKAPAQSRSFSERPERKGQGKRQSQKADTTTGSVPTDAQ